MVKQITGRGKIPKHRLILDFEGAATNPPHLIGLLVVNMQNFAIDRLNLVVTDIVPEKTRGKHFYKGYKVKREKAKKIIVSFMRKYNIKEIWAFGYVEKSGMKRLFNTSLENIPCFKGVQWYNIQSAIMPKLLTKKYVAFCNNTKGGITPNGNISTSAQNIYRYLTNDVNFKEVHQGLTDCIIEWHILQKAINSKKKFKYTEYQKHYILLKDFCLSFMPPLKPY